MSGKTEIKNSEKFIVNSEIHGDIFFGSTPFNVKNYIDCIIKDSDNSLREQRFVDIWTHENISFELDTFVVEILHTKDLKIPDDPFHKGESIAYSYEKESQEIENKNQTEEYNEQEEQQIKQRVERVLTIASDTQRFVLVGKPGSGKTTALKKVHYDRAKKILEFGIDIKIPVFIEAKYYNKKNGDDFESRISKTLGTDPGNTRKLLYEGKLHILIDGVNEIDADQKNIAFEEINNLMDYYDGCAFIISSRKQGFKNKFKIPEFELKELQIPEIKEFIVKHNSKNSELLWQELDQNEKFRELAENPLLLFLINYAFARNGGIPKNKASLFKFFVDTILINEFDKSSEKRKKFYISEEFYTHEKTNLLSYFSFLMKLEGKTVIEKRLVRSNFFQEQEYELFFELLNSPLLSENEGNITFFHETFLDYFAGLYIMQNFERNIKNKITIKDIGVDDISLSQWYEPLILCGDLLAMKSEQEVASFLDLLFFNSLNINTNPFVLNIVNHEYRNGKHNFFVDRKSFDVNNPISNEDILIPCKISYNLKHEYPNIFNKMKRRLRNYMSLWILGYDCFKIIMPIEKLFSAIGALSCEDQLDEIFYNLDWQEVWLYSNNFNKNTVDLFIKNISDFEACLSLLSNKEKRKQNKIWPDIENKITQLENKLLSSTSLNELKRFYLGNPENTEVLKFIGKIDIDFYIDNFDLTTQTASGFIDYVSEKINIQRVRLKLLWLLCQSDISYDDQLKIYTLLLNSVFKNEILIILEEKLPSIDEIYFIEKIMPLLYNVPYNQIPEKIKEKLGYLFEIKNKNILDLLNTETQAKNKYKISIQILEISQFEKIRTIFSVGLKNNQYSILTKELIHKGSIIKFSDIWGIDYIEDGDLVFNLYILAPFNEALLEERHVKMGEDILKAKISFISKARVIPLSIKEKITHPAFFENNSEFINRLDAILSNDKLSKYMNQPL